MAGFTANWASQIRPVEQPDVLGTARTIMGIQEAKSLQRQRELAAQKSAQEQAESQLVLKSWGENGGDVDKTVKALEGKVAPERLLKLQEAHGQALSEKLKASKEQFDLDAKRYEVMGSVAEQLLQAPPEKRADLWTASAEALKPFLGDRPVPQTPPSDEELQTMAAIAAGQTGVHKQAADARAALAKKALDDAEEERKKAKEARDVAESAAKLPGEQAKAEREILQNAATQLGSSKDEAEYQKRRGKLPFDVASKFPDKFDREAVLNRGRTPEQQATPPNPTEYSLAVTAAKGELGANATDAQISAKAIEIANRAKPTTEKPATKAQFAQAATRKNNAIAALNRQIADTTKEPMGWPAYRDALQAVQNAYEEEVVNLGGTAEHVEVPSAAELEAQAKSKRSGSPVTAAPSKYKEGQKVTLRNGQVVTIKKINNDGTFEY